MNRLEYKVAVIAAGVGFIMGVAMLIIMRLFEPQNVYAQDPIQPNLNPSKLGLPSRLPNAQQFSAITAEVVDIQSLILRKNLDFYNGSGKKIASLSMHQGLPEFQFYDPRDGRTRLKIFLEDESGPLASMPRIYLYGLKETPRLLMRTYNNNEGMIALAGPGSTPRFKVECDPKLGTKLTLGYEEDKWASLQCNISSSDLILKNGKGQNQLVTVIKN